MRCPAQSATGGWVIPGLLSKWFPLCEFSLLVALTVKHLPTMRETQVQSLGWEDLLEKEMATHSTTLALKIPWTEEPGRLQSTGLQRLGHNWVTLLSLSGSVLWKSRVLESVLPLQRLRALSLVRNEDSTSVLLWHLVRLKQISKNEKPKMNFRQMAVRKLGK